MIYCLFKDTHREKAPSNKTPTLSKSMNMDICMVDKSNNFFAWGSWTKIKFSKKIVTGKTSFFVIKLFCIFYSICHTLAFDKQILYGNVAFSISVISTKNGAPIFQKGFALLSNLFQSFKFSNFKSAKTCAKTKVKSNFALNIAEMLKKAATHFCLFYKWHFSNIRTF